MFDSRVEEAIQQLWVDPWNGDGEHAKKLLEEAAEEGNGDAYYFLGRCYLGNEFILPKFGFKEDNERGIAYFNKSIELGSAVGIFGARRVAGFKPKCGSFIQPPFLSLKEVWDAVRALADEGEVFCQYMLANAYYYGDCIEMLEIPEEQVDGPMIQSFQREAIELFEKSIKKKLVLGIANLIDILSSGDYGIKEDPKRVQELIEIGAKLQHPYYECKYGTQLEDTNLDEAVRLYEKSIMHGEDWACYRMGRLYTYGGKLPQDLQKAMYYFKKGIEIDPDTIGCNNSLGEIYFKGGDGVEVDYEKAVKCFERTTKQGNNWACAMLGQCYLKGLGTPVDYDAARRMFLEDPEDELAAVGLGEIYCYGLGVPANVKLGMDKYIIPNVENERAKEICADYRSGKIGGKKARLHMLCVEMFICAVIAIILCVAAELLLVELPAKMEQKKDPAKQVETVKVEKGAIGTEYVDGVAVLTSTKEVLASKDVFVLPLDSYVDYKHFDYGTEHWGVISLDGKYIPVKYNSHAETDNYTPIGKLVKKPCGKIKDLKAYAHQDESAIEKDVYIDMDGGMYEKQEGYEEKVRDAKLEKYVADMDEDQGRNTKLAKAIMYSCIPMILLLHFLGTAIGLFEPVFQKKE
ncbi:putative uncharacterized protein [Clostridium sp. CAG:411]|jgi:TPR repeat protein|nr:SEL1-like repeat protein [Lachnospiraceae bacterium]CDE42217.1 putative uncharacterized protein [Clostridium sp. CAG:411]